MQFDGLIYDVEIKRLIPSNTCDYSTHPQYKFCGGWGDLLGMGIACICAFDCGEGMPRIFLHDNLDEFADLAARREYVVGFNSIAFDDKLCAANGISVTTTYDLYCEAKIAGGHKAGSRVRGYGLDSLSAANLSVGKSGDGAMAPMNWQDKKPGCVIDYCMRDVILTYKLLARGLDGKLNDPLTNKPILLRSLFDGKHGGPQARLPL